LILVCGEALMDAIEDADGTQRMMPGGGPFNTARALARLGVPTAFLGHLSTDAFGRRLAELLAADGAGLTLASYGPEPTTVAVAKLHGAGLAEYEFVVDGTSAPNLTAAMIPDNLAPDITAIHLGTLGLVLEPMASTLTELIRRVSGQRLVMLDPNIRQTLLSNANEYRQRIDFLISRSTIVKASQDDLAWLYPGLDYEAAAERVLESGVRLAVATLGARGAYAATPDVRLTVDAPPTKVVDTIGAGDAFSAGLLAWLNDHDLLRADLNLKRDELRAAVELACLVASLTVARAGADPPTRADLRKLEA
jgi:fructokinase